MRFADFMGYPWPQNEIMSKNYTPISAEITENLLVHTTTVDPRITDFDEIHEIQIGFARMLTTRHHALVQRKRDLRREGLKVMCGLQHPPEEASPWDVKELFAAGIRIMTLGYELENEYGGGFACPSAPLTYRGEGFLEAMSEAGMVLDLSHAGHETARGALKFIREANLPLRVVASHSGSYAVYEHLRNLPDDILIEIKDQGGIVGVPTATFMLHPEINTLEPFFTHLEHIVELLGSKSVVIGSDGIYRSLDLEKRREHFEMMKREIDPRGNFRARFPDDAEGLNTPRRHEFISREIFNRHSLSAAEDIVGANTFRFLETALP